MTKICLGCMAHYEDEYNICPTCGYVEDTPAAETTQIEPGSKLQDRYIVGKALGHGGFGVTYIGWDSLIERAVAIKEYLPAEFSTRTPGQTNITVYTGDKSEQFASGLDRFIDEAQRLAKFTSIEGIVNIYDTFAENNTAYIIMELLQGETLAAMLNRAGKISDKDALMILVPIIKSLKLVHEKGIIHRDIAPDNIFLLNDGSAKLIDFGAARFSSMLNNHSLTVIVKPGYSPEEQYQSKAIQGAYTDVYAISATLYRMITGVVPPNALDRRASIELKQKELLAPPSKYCTIGENTETAILNALNVRIEDRTRDMSTFLYELTTNDAVKRQHGQINGTSIKYWPLWAKIGVPAVLCIITIFTLLFATGLMPFNRNDSDAEAMPEGMTRVPSVINNNLDIAESRLFEAELLYSIIGKEFSSEIAMNYVLEQDINGGTLVDVNTLLSLVVSGGVETRTMPSVKGAPLEEATSVLEYLEFDVNVEEQYSPVEEGMVILHDIPSDSELEVGGTVTLFVSEGADPSIILEDEVVIVPDFIDMSYSDVLVEAENLGATLAVNTEYSPTVEKNQIVSQSVPADSEIMPGDTVDITVSLGVETVRVRDVQFRTAGEAVTILEEQGLKIALIYDSSDTVANNVVINQMPAVNTVVEPGAEVTIVVSWDMESSPPEFEGPADDNQELELELVWKIEPTFEYDIIVYCDLCGFNDNIQRLLVNESTGEIIDSYSGHRRHVMDVLYDEALGLFGVHHWSSTHSNAEFFSGDELLSIYPFLASSVNLIRGVDSTRIVIEDIEGLISLYDLSEAYTGKYAISIGVDFVTGFVFDDGEALTESRSNNIIAVQRDDYWGIIDRDGNTVVPFVLEHAITIDDYTAFARYDGRYGILYVNQSHGQDSDFLLFLDHLTNQGYVIMMGMSREQHFELQRLEQDNGYRPTIPEHQLPSGIIGMKQSDFDSDGENEMLVIFTTPIQRSTELYQEANQLSARMFQIENGAVVERARVYFDDISILPSASTSGYSEVFVKTDEQQIIIGVNSAIRFGGFWANGSETYLLAYAYEDGDFVNILSEGGWLGGVWDDGFEGQAERMREAGFTVSLQQRISEIEQHVEVIASVEHHHPADWEELDSIRADLFTGIRRDIPPVIIDIIGAGEDLGTRS